MDAAHLHALAAKAAVVWISNGVTRPASIWFGWHEMAVHAVVGGPEQPDPFGPSGSDVTLSLPSKDTRAVAARARARVVDLPPGTAAWHSAAAVLAAQRLNSREPDLVEAWATRSRLVRLEILHIEPETSADPAGGVQPIDGASVRPRGWRSMRAHARPSSARSWRSSG